MTGDDFDDRERYLQNLPDCRLCGSDRHRTADCPEEREEEERRLACRADAQEGGHWR